MFQALELIEKKRTKDSGRKINEMSGKWGTQLAEKARENPWPPSSAAISVSSQSGIQKNVDRLFSVTAARGEIAQYFHKSYISIPALLLER